MSKIHYRKKFNLIYDIKIKKSTCPNNVTDMTSQQLNYGKPAVVSVDIFLLTS